MRRFVLWCLQCGCLSTLIPDPPSARSDAALQQLLARGEFRGANFAHINRAPYESGLHPADLVNVYVSAEAAAEYRLISPDRLGPAPPIPVGTLIVREILDDVGAVVRLTVMEKREPHSFDGGGDFWFAVTEPDGTPQTDEKGNAEWGPLEACGSCHASRERSSWLFGVSEDDR